MKLSAGPMVAAMVSLSMAPFWMLLFPSRPWSCLAAIALNVGCFVLYCEIQK